MKLAISAAVSSQRPVLCWCSAPSLIVLSKASNVQIKSSLRLAGPFYVDLNIHLEYFNETVQTLSSIFGHIKGTQKDYHQKYEIRYDR